MSIRNDVQFDYLGEYSGTRFICDQCGAVSARMTLDLLPPGWSVELGEPKTTSGYRFWTVRHQDRHFCPEHRPV